MYRGRGSAKTSRGVVGRTVVRNQSNAAARGRDRQGAFDAMRCAPACAHSSELGGRVIRTRACSRRQPSVNVAPPPPPLSRLLYLSRNNKRRRMCCYRRDTHVFVRRPSAPGSCPGATEAGQAGHRRPRENDMKIIEMTETLRCRYKLSTRLVTVS